ncbi:DUF86 domain-containing protein [Parasediminibacterium sp. JCM 36343]|uniref:HepT-like ribonuclease domain-containing protein n=1 Tax=Parasediminibacterium sp. JCM 36343 TaxID=3374279 RepID=UPI00397CD714
MSLDELKLLNDIKVSISLIDVHLDYKRNFEAYINNITSRRAVERELEIIGEAISKILKINPSIPLSYARLIVDLRNKIIHSYDNINNVIIWKILVKDIPVLQQEVADLLDTKT